MKDDLVFESTSDTVEQIREGLGLPPAEATAAEAPAAQDAATEQPAADAAGAADASPEQPAEGAESGATRPGDPVQEASGRVRDAKSGKFVAKPKPEPPELLTERQKREAAERERDELRQQVQQPKPQPSAPQPSAIDPDTYRDPAVTAKFDKLRKDLGDPPDQQKIDDYDEFRAAERAYDRKLAKLDTLEDVAHQRSAEVAMQAERDAHAAVVEQVRSYEGSVASAKARHADFDEAMEAGKSIPWAGRPYAAELQAAILQMPDAGEVIYYLARRPDDIAKLQAAPTVFRAIEMLGRMAVEASAAGAASAASAPSGATQTGPAVHVPAPKPPPSAPVSRAPLPQGTVLGNGGGSVSTKLEDVPDQRTYNRIREQQIRDRRGR